MIERLPFTLHLTFGQEMTLSYSLAIQCRLSTILWSQNERADFAKDHGIECRNLGTLPGKSRRVVAS